MNMRDFPFFGRRRPTAPSESSDLAHSEPALHRASSNFPNRGARRGQATRAAHRARQSRSLGAEFLEARAMLAANFHNDLAPADVNKDGHLSNADMLVLVSDLRNNGPRKLATGVDAPGPLPGTGGLGTGGLGSGGMGGGIGGTGMGEGEPGGLDLGPYIDVNGDGYASSMDAFLVGGALRFARGEGENETVAFTLQATRTIGGAPANFFGLGESFFLEVYVEDLRPPAPNRGVASAFLDLTWDADIASVVPAIPTAPEFFDFEITFGPDFDDPVFTEVASQQPQFIDEAGSISDDINSPLGSGRFLLFAVEFTADALGTVTYASAFADQPTNEVTTNEPPQQVLANDILFGTLTLDIVDVRAVDDAFTLPEDSIDFVIDALDNDVSTQGDPQLIEIVNAPANGVATIDDNGTPADPTDDFVRYSPDPDYFGPDSFTYRMNGGSTTDTATVTLTITEVNDPPVATNETLVTRINESINFTLQDLLAGDTPGPENESDQTLDVVLPLATTSAQGGTIFDNGNGTYTYTPPVDFVGDDSFVYTVIDNGTTAGVDDPQSTLSTVPIVVRPINQLVAFTLRAVDSTTGNPVGSVTPGDTFSLQVFVDDLRDLGVDGGVGAAYVDIFFDSTIPAPGVEMISTDQVITFGSALPDANRGTVTESVNPGEIDEAGGARFDLNQTVGSAPVFLFSVDFVVTAAFNGVVRFTSNPADNPINEVVLADTGRIVGPEEVIYGSLDLRIETPSPTAPVAVANSYTTLEDVALVVTNPGNVSGDGSAPTGSAPFGVLANDTDVDQPPTWLPGTTLQAVLESTTSNGSLTLNADGTFTYLPNENFFGTDSFTYRASDGSNLSNVVTVTIAVTSVNDAPVANNDPANATAYHVDLEATVVVPASQGVLINDFDPDAVGLTPPVEPGSTLSVTDPPLFGNLTLNDNGSFSYTPFANVSAGTIDTFEYTLTDPFGASDSAIVTIAIGASPGDVFGVVYFDADHDGVRDPLERGIGGVAVRLFGTDVFGNTPIDITVLTNSDGEYSFPGLLSGSYTLEQTQPYFLLDGFDSVNDVRVNGSATAGNPANDRFVGVIPSTATRQRSYNFGERGLRPEYFTLWEFVFNDPNSGVSIALDTDGFTVWYTVGRTGWEGIEQIEVTLSEDRTEVTILATDAGGASYTKTLPTTDERVEVLQVSGGFFVRLAGDFADFDFELV